MDKKPETDPVKLIAKSLETLQTEVTALSQDLRAQQVAYSVLSAALLSLARSHPEPKQVATDFHRQLGAIEKMHRQLHPGDARYLDETKAFLKALERGEEIPF